MPRALAVARAAVIAALVPLALLFIYARFAPLEAPEAMLVAPGTVVLGADGTVLQRDTRDGIRIPVGLDRIAPIMVEATIAAEDRRFRSHPGVDPLAIARALASRDSQPSGASTITQQLARRLYLRDDAEPLVARKAREALIALQLEARRSKDEILALYLNDVFYGRGAYGVEAAARVYFDTSARDLDLAQAAFLAGLPQSPSIFDPADPQRAADRQAYVLDRMVAAGEITRQRADEAAARPLRFAPELAAPLAPHLVRYALDELARLRPDLARQRGLVVQTTIDPGIQRTAERSVRLRLADLRDKAATNAAVVVLDPSSGAIVAMVGSADFDDPAGGQINMAVQPRQPGSAIKPILYLDALEHGFTAATPLLDVPTTFTTRTGPYAPLDADRRFRGIVPLRVALASSLNIPAVRTLDQLGIDSFLDVAHRLGLRTLSDTEVYGLALTLGGGEVRLLDLTAAYGAFATGGELAEPFAVARVVDAAGAVAYRRPAASPTRVASPEDAFVLADILADRVARIPTFGEGTPLDLPFRAAVKTGTTTAFHDNWTVGFTPDRVVGVWVGNTDGRPMQDLSGVDGAAPIWRDVLEAAVADLPPRWPAPPSGLVRATVCAPTGLLPGAQCPTSAAEWFRAGREPTEVERYYGRDADGTLTIDPPLEARAWAMEAGFRLASTPPRDPGSVHIVAPAPGAVLYIAPELNAQVVMLRASAPSGAIAVDIRVDGVLVDRVDGSEATAIWTLVPGTHVIEATARLADGTRVSSHTTFEVRA